MLLDDGKIRPIIEGGSVCVRAYVGIVFTYFPVCVCVCVCVFMCVYVGSFQMFSLNGINKLLCVFVCACVNVGLCVCVCCVRMRTSD